jgi:hypothetical protein
MRIFFFRKDQIKRILLESILIKITNRKTNKIIKKEKHLTLLLTLTLTKT